jgi:hypothetical protein
VVAPKVGGFLANHNGHRDDRTITDHEASTPVSSSTRMVRVGASTTEVGSGGEAAEVEDPPAKAGMGVRGRKLARPAGSMRGPFRVPNVTCPPTRREPGQEDRP